MNLTEYYNLRKPEMADPVNINDLNTNAGIIDNALHNLSNKITTNENTLKTKASTSQLNTEISKVKNDLNNNITKINSSLEEKANEINMERERFYNEIRRSNSYSKLNKYEYPSDFSLRYDELPTIYKDDKVGFSTNFDVSVYKNVSSKSVYFDTEIGTSNNDGLTKDTPCQSLTKALTLINSGDTIVCLNKTGSVLGRSVFPTNGVINKSFNLIFENKGVICFKGDIPIWTKTTGYTNIYEVTRSLVVRLADMNDIENPVEYEKVDSLDTLNTTSYAWYTDGTKTYVNCGNNRIPNDKILPLINANNAVLQVSGATSNIKLYLENAIFVGGNENVYIQGNADYNGHELYTKNCKFLFSIALDNVLTQNAKRSYHQNSVCAYSAKDGFNYSTNIGNSNIVDFIEVNTKAYACGDNSLNSPDTHNGSTAHAKSHGIRINCTYYNTVGGQLIDTQQVKSVNLGCIAYDSKSVQDSYKQGMGSQGDAEMWFEGCVSFGNIYDMHCHATGTIHIKNCQYDTDYFAGTVYKDTRL